MGPTLEAYGRNDLAAVNAHLGRTCQRLADAGCDFFVCPDNTAHIALDAAVTPFPLPGLHLAEIVAQRARADGRRRVALLGTRWTMEGPTYPTAFARAGVELCSPAPEERARIDRVIFDELCQGILRDGSRSDFVAIIERIGEPSVRGSTHVEGALAATSAGLGDGARLRERGPGAAGRRAHGSAPRTRRARTGLEGLAEVIGSPGFPSPEPGRRANSAQPPRGESSC